MVEGIWELWNEVDFVSIVNIDGEILICGFGLLFLGLWKLVLMWCFILVLIIMWLILICYMCVRVWWMIVFILWIGFVLWEEEKSVFYMFFNFWNFRVGVLYGFCWVFVYVVLVFFDWGIVNIEMKVNYKILLFIIFSIIIVWNLFGMFLYYLKVL